MNNDRSYIMLILGAILFIYGACSFFTDNDPKYFFLSLIYLGFEGVSIRLERIEKLIDSNYYAIKRVHDILNPPTDEEKPEATQAPTVDEKTENN